MDELAETVVIVDNAMKAKLNSKINIICLFTCLKNIFPLIFLPPLCLFSLLLSNHIPKLNIVVF